MHGFLTDIRKRDAILLGEFLEVLDTDARTVWTANAALLAVRNLDGAAHAFVGGCD